MIKLFRNRKFIIFLFLLIFFIALMGLTLTRSNLTWPERFVKDTVGWTQQLFYRPASAVSDFFESIRELRVVFAENQVLKKTISQYAKDTMRLNALEEENKSLQLLLNFTERQKQADNYAYRVAKVVAVGPDIYSSIININLGAKDGIKVNMAVMSVNGLIGRIKSVAEFTASVQLLTGINDTNTDENSLSKAIAVTVKGKENVAFGIVENFVSETQQLVVTKIEKENNFAVGDLVVTSGMGGVFPRGIEIGTVMSTSMGDFGITYKAMVQPKAEFRHLREVLVVEVPDTR